LVSEETLHKVREAFDRLRRDGVLKGWELDDKIVSPFSQESGSIKLTVCLLRGESERASILLDPVGVAEREREVTVSGLSEEIRRALDEKALLSY
jgi:hypothetical protein